MRGAAVRHDSRYYSFIKRTIKTASCIVFQTDGTFRSLMPPPLRTQLSRRCGYKIKAGFYVVRSIHVAYTRAQRLKCQSNRVVIRS